MGRQQGKSSETEVVSLSLYLLFFCIFMKPKIIHSSNIKEKDLGRKKVKDIINQKNWPFSIAIVKKVDKTKIGYDKESNLVYYVLDGKGKSMINGKEYSVKKGDFIILPKGTRYKNSKGLTLLAISYPRFDRSKRVYLE